MTKSCSKCGEEKPLEEFGLDSRMNLGRRSACNPCVAATARKSYRVHVEARRTYARERVRRKTAEDPDWSKKRWAAFTPEQRRTWNRRCKLKSYGLTEADFNRMVENQSGKCLVCGQTPPTDAGANKSILHVDHCHTTGRVRGLLCHACNVTIGLAQENPDILEKAAEYLRRFNKELVNGCI